VSQHPVNPPQREREERVKELGKAGSFLQACSGNGDTNVRASVGDP
jgi:hypothetical protein